MIPAGIPPKRTIGPNECAKITTGSVVPSGADCVIMKEYVEVPIENTVRFVGEQTANNICQRGEDVRTGDIVLNKGTLLRPQHIAVLASVGHIHPLVAKRPRVAVIATGDELVEPASKPGPAQIRNSNGSQLAVHAEGMGAIVANYGVAKDVTPVIENVLKKALEENDVIIISGGISAGDYDLVKEAMKQNSIRLLFDKVAVKPGMPTVFGVSEKAFCFGLPGNPVSTFVIFELLVKPFLYRMMGHNFKPVITLRQLKKTITRKKTEKVSWLPVIFTENGKAANIAYHGSGHINALCKADGLLCIPKGVAEIKEGTTVAIRQI
jgi:molybdopterin molybdotransferase